MHLIGTILIGFIAGLLAKWLHPGRESMGFILTSLLGIAGSLVATFAGQALHWYAPGENAGFIGAVIGAIVILAIFGQVAQKSD